MNEPRIGRRAFLQAAAATATALVAVRHAPATAAHAADLRVGAVLPADDTSLLGVRLGAHEAAHAARLFGTAFSLHEAPPDAAGVERLAAEHAVHVVVAGAPAEAAAGQIRAALARDMVVMNVGAPLEATGLCDARLFHLLPSRAMRAAARGSAARAEEVVGWHPSLERFGAAQVNDRFRDMFGVDMDERAWTGWVAIKIAFDAVQRTGTSAAPALAAHLASPQASWDGHKGVQLSFRPQTRQLRQPLYVVSGGEVVAEVPSTRDLGDRTHAELLDTITGNGETDACAG